MLGDVECFGGSRSSAGSPACHHSIFCTFFFCAEGAMQSPCTFFFCWPIILRFVQNHSMGDCSYPGWNFCFLHLNNCRCFSRGNWTICPGPGCVAAGGRQKDFLPLGAFLWGRGFPQISLVPNYIQSLEWMWLLISPLVFVLLQ